MRLTHWRELLDVVSAIAIVVGLVLVAQEIRQANHIARTELVLDLASEYNVFNSARFQDPGVAHLGVLLMSSQSSETTPIEASMMAGASWHFTNIFWSAQFAYENGLIDLSELERYRADLEWMLNYMPGLTPEFVNIYQTVPTAQGMYVFEPLAEYLDARDSD